MESSARVLSVVVAESATATQQRLLLNAKAFAGASAVFDWVVVALDNNAEAWEGTRHVASRILGGGICFVCNPELSPGFHVKLLLQLSVFSLSRHYSSVFLMDSDIRFSQGGAHNFVQRWRCLRGSPLVTQPILNTRHTGGKRSVNTNFWPLAAWVWRQGSHLLPRWLLGVCGVAINFTEQMVVILDGGFYRWLMLTVGQRLAQVQEDNKNDYCLSSIWCGAAAAYARTVLNGTDRVPCALTTTSFDHDSTGTVNKSEAYQHGARRVRSFVRKTWPEWFRDPAWIGYSSNNWSAVKQMLHQYEQPKSDLCDSGRSDRCEEATRGTRAARSMSGGSMIAGMIDERSIQMRGY